MPATSALQASSVFQPVSMTAAPEPSSSKYTSTYRNGLFGSGTGIDQRPGRTRSTSGNATPFQDSRCAVPVTSIPLIGPGSAGGVDGIGREVFQEDVGHVGPVLVGDPVGSSLELEQVIVAGAVLRGAVGVLPGEDRVVI